MLEKTQACSVWCHMIKLGFQTEFEGTLDARNLVVGKDSNVNLVSSGRAALLLCFTLSVMVLGN